MPLPPLGIGLAYQPDLEPFIEAHIEAFDFLEVVPDVAWNDLGPASPVRYVFEADRVAFVRRISATRAVVPHSIGLSIGSASSFDEGHVAQMSRWLGMFPSPWHSDHLAFHRASNVNLNFTMALPLDDDVLCLVAERAAAVRRTIERPFLLENNVYYCDLPGQAYDEPAFLNALHDASGCGVLLDLHNLHANCRNRGWSAGEYLDRLNLDAVGEIHVAGGMMFRGMYVDAHSGESPLEVLDLLEQVLPQCANVGGVVFEIFGSWFDTIGADGLRRQLGGMRNAWARHKPSPLRGAHVG